MKPNKDTKMILKKLKLRSEKPSTTWSPNNLSIKSCTIALSIKLSNVCSAQEALEVKHTNPWYSLGLAGVEPTLYRGSRKK
jgi:hypothetical protein